MEVHDFAVIYLDSNFIGSFDRSQSTEHKFNATCASSCKLTILVEAMGHINFDHGMETDYKGLISFKDGKAISFSWNIYTINVDKNISTWRMLSDKSFPSLSRAVFNVSSVGDTYLNLKNYKKGYIWVNGRNLGRYWNIGPSQKVFCPGVWLKQGQNDLIILDLLTDEVGELTGDTTLN
jgi:beta-galactosidase